MYKINRLFLFIAALAVMVVALAWVVLNQEIERRAQRIFQPFELFPQLIEQRANIKIMQLEIGRGLSGVQKIILWREKGDKLFRVRQADNFFAKQDLTNRLIYGAAKLKVEVARGSSKDELTKLGLIAPEKLGPAIRISFYLYEPKNKKFVSFLVGARPEAIGDVLGQSSIYIRRAGENQSYRARGALPLRTRIQDWLDLGFLTRSLNDTSKAKGFVLAKAQFSLLGKKGWVLKRPSAQGAWAVSDRRGLRLSGIFDEKIIALVEDNIKNLTFSAVQDVKNINFSKPHIVIFESFSGLAIVLEIVRQANGYWARINVRATSLTAQAQAKKLQGYLEGFAFLLPVEQAQKIILTPNNIRKRKK